MLALCQHNILSYFAGIFDTGLNTGLLKKYARSQELCVYFSSNHVCTETIRGLFDYKL